jgi:c-di-GMP-binding flagellar brake protein YcgR
MGLEVLNVMYPGDKLEMHYINSLNKDLILETLIYDVLSEDEILIHNPLFEGKLYMIPMNIEITAFTKRADVGVIAFSLQLLKREKQGNVYTIRCKITSELEKQQRRHYYRVKMFTDMEVYCMVDVQGHPVDYYIFDPDTVEEQQVDFKVSILDISGGGVGLRSRIDLPIGTYIYGKVQLATRVIEVVGVVVRAMPSTKYINEFELGVMFKDLDHESTRIITSYVFKAQQEARRKELKHAKD